jgi:hypothetical protein
LKPSPTTPPPFQPLRRVALFLFAGAFSALFVLHFLRSRQGDEIAATPEVVAALEEERRELLGRPLTEAERQRLADDWIAQEVLVREAMKRGLDRGDGVIRHRLVEKMRVLLREPPREPTRSELEAFHREHEERYRTAERVSLEHVFFFKTSEAAAGATSRLAALRAGADFRRMGERFWLGPVFQGVTQPELGRVLGEPFAKAVFALPLETWTGPLESIRGVHLVRVTARRAAAPAPFEAVENEVREDWQEARDREALERHLLELKKAYRISTPAAAAPAASPSN